MSPLSLLFIACFVVAVASAQSVATPCDLLARPMDFNGKQVRITGTVQAGFDDFLLRSENCTGIRGDTPAAIWIDLPEGTHSKAGPAIRTTLSPQVGSAPAVTSVSARLIRNHDFKVFEDALSAPLRTRGLCLGCLVNTVTATLTGRVEAVQNLEWQRSGKRFTAIPGFGNLNAYRIRIVLEEVADVTSHPIDYTGASPAMEVASPALPAGDPVTLLKSSAEVFPNGSAVYGQLRRAAVALGTPANRDGILLRPFSPNEDHPSERAPSQITSSDGLNATVDYDSTRLGLDALVRALAIVGCQIADLREARSRPQLVDLDGHSLQTLVLEAAASGARSLILPGGAALWIAAWPEEQRRQRVAAALTLYLGRWKQDVILRTPAIH